MTSGTSLSVPRGTIAKRRRPLMILALGLVAVVALNDIRAHIVSSKGLRLRQPDHDEEAAGRDATPAQMQELRNTTLFPTARCDNRSEVAPGMNYFLCEDNFIMSPAVIARYTQDELDQAQFIRGGHKCVVVALSNLLRSLNPIILAFSLRGCTVFVLGSNKTKLPKRAANAKLFHVADGKYLTPAGFMKYLRLRHRISVIDVLLLNLLENDWEGVIPQLHFATRATRVLQLFSKNFFLGDSLGTRIQKHSESVAARSTWRDQHGRWNSIADRPPKLYPVKIPYDELARRIDHYLVFFKMFKTFAIVKTPNGATFGVGREQLPCTLRLSMLAADYQDVADVDEGIGRLKKLHTLESVKVALRNQR